MSIIRIAAIAATMLVAFPAIADQADDVNAARLHYKKGTRAFELGHYTEAIKEYEAAYEAKDDPALLYNIGQAYRLNGNTSEALRAYKSYLHRLPDAPNADEVRNRIDELQKTLDAQQRAKPAPAPAPPPLTTAPAPATAPATPTPATTAAASPKTETDHATPVYKKWWLWTIVGVVVIGGVATGVALALTLSHSDGFKSSLPDVGPGMHSALTVRF